MGKRKEERREFFKAEFDALATDGAIGDPNGQPAYAYIRVSSDGQAEEGRDGLPRQIRHIDEIAKQDGYRISWSMVYADDHTGFEFEDRPELSKLRREYRNGKRASVVVMERHDRLSRDVDDQGWLLKDMRKHNITPVFWKSFGSKIERLVTSTVEQEAMELAKERMHDGTISKAQKRQRITAKKPAYGFKFVDSQGRSGETARKDTCYAHVEPKASAVRRIFEAVGIERVALRRLAGELDQLYPPPGIARHWTGWVIASIIKNPVYKGEFAANRWQQVTKYRPAKDGLEMRKVKTLALRPKDEWIIIADPKVVPPIVSPELWQLANDALAINKKTARRNAKEPYLLTGLLKCAVCGYSSCGVTKHNKRRGRVSTSRLYRCPSRSGVTVPIRAEIGCTQGQILCRTVDNAVWAAVSEVLSDPDYVADALDRRYSDGANTDLLRQIAHLEGEIDKLQAADQKDYEAYQSGAFDAREFAEKRQLTKGQVQAKQNAIEQLRRRVISAEQIEAQKVELLTLAAQLRKCGDLADVSFEVKQRVLKIMVEAIHLNVADESFVLESPIAGLFNGAYSLRGIVYGSVRRY